MTDPATATHEDVQRAQYLILDRIAEIPIPRLPTLEESVPVALRLAYVAMSMSPDHQEPALIVARTYADHVGLDFEIVQEQILSLALEHKDSNND